jgi:hypothetical protein
MWGYLETMNITGSKNKDNWSGKKMLKFHEGHWTLPSNFD